MKMWTEVEVKDLENSFKDKGIKGYNEDAVNLFKKHATKYERSEASVIRKAMDIKLIKVKKQERL